MGNKKLNMIFAFVLGVIVALITVFLIPMKGDFEEGYTQGLQDVYDSLMANKSVTITVPIGDSLTIKPPFRREFVNSNPECYLSCHKKISFFLRSGSWTA